MLRAWPGCCGPSAAAIALGDWVWLDRERGGRPAAGAALGRPRLPGLRALPAPRVRANVAFGGAGAGRRAARALPDLAPRGREAGRALGRRAPARRARTRAGTGPRVLLLDEPLSALDAHTRATVRAELRELLHELGLPTLVVTHDFEDAASLADRVGVIVDGHVLQSARRPTSSPLRPTRSWPASPAPTSSTGSRPRGRTASRRSSSTAAARCTRRTRASGRVALVVYPWEVALAGRRRRLGRQPRHAPIASIVRLGNRVRVRMGPVTAEITAESASGSRSARGDRRRVVQGDGDQACARALALDQRREQVGVLPQVAVGEELLDRARATVLTETASQLRIGEHARHVQPERGQVGRVVDEQSALLVDDLILDAADGGRDDRAALRASPRPRSARTPRRGSSA